MSINEMLEDVLKQNDAKPNPEKNLQRIVILEETLDKLKEEVKIIESKLK